MENFFMRTMKTLIILGGCAGRLESSLGAEISYVSHVVAMSWTTIGPTTDVIKTKIS